MEPQRKRTYDTSIETTLDDGYQNKSLSSNSYMNKVGEELEHILSYAEGPTQMTREEDIKKSLVQLGHDVNDIKWTLEKKKPKITLLQLNEKLDFIIEILRSAHGN